MSNWSPSAQPLDLPDMLRTTYSGWQIYCHTAGLRGAEQWNAARRAKDTEQSQRAGILQHVEKDSGQFLADALAEQVILIRSNAADHWPTP